MGEDITDKFVRVAHEILNDSRIVMKDLRMSKGLFRDAKEVIFGNLVLSA